MTQVCCCTPWWLCLCGVLAEAEHTVTKYVGFLPGVCVLQVHQRGTLQEALVTLGASVGLLTQMPLQVPH